MLGARIRSSRHCALCECTPGFINTLLQFHGNANISGLRALLRDLLVVHVEQYNDRRGSRPCLEVREMLPSFCMTSHNRAKFTQCARDTWRIGVEHCFIVFANRQLHPRGVLRALAWLAAGVASYTFAGVASSALCARSRVPPQQGEHIGMTARKKSNARSPLEERTPSR